MADQGIRVINFLPVVCVCVCVCVRAVCLASNRHGKAEAMEVHGLQYKAQAGTRHGRAHCWRRLQPIPTRCWRIPTGVSYTCRHPHGPVLKWDKHESPPFAHGTPHAGNKSPEWCALDAPCHRRSPSETQASKENRGSLLCLKARRSLPSLVSDCHFLYRPFFSFFFSSSNFKTSKTNI